MARTNHVKSYQGKRACQKAVGVGLDALCGVTKGDHAATPFRALGIPWHLHQGGTIRCGACSEPIKVGDAYKFKVRKTGPRSSTKLSRHEDCPEWKPSELTGSPFLQIFYGTQEAAAPPDVDDKSTPEDLAADLKAIAEAFAEAAQEMADIRTEAADNIEDGFGHETEQSSELRYQGEHATEVANELDYWEAEEFDAEGTYGVEGLDEDDEDDEDRYEEETADALISWVEDQFQAAVDIFDTAADG
jgi:hypothetical protein